MAEVIHLTGVEQATRCLAAARKAETFAEADAWLRLHSRYMQKREVTRTPVAVGSGRASAQVCQRMGSR